MVIPKPHVGVFHTETACKCGHTWCESDETKTWCTHCGAVRFGTLYRRVDGELIETDFPFDAMVTRADHKFLAEMGVGQ